MEISCANVNDGLVQGLSYLIEQGVSEPSRNGAVLVAPEPVLITYRKPWERVLFSPMRDANPFFHLFESLWMLAGRNDLAFPVVFNKRFKEYSDDGAVINGAYGFRWREHFNTDQLAEAAAMLAKDPSTRRVVVGMWDPSEDLGSPSKDIPCNTHIYFDVRGGTLNMTVCNRSNDVLWGTFGANAVHMSILQEYMATLVGLPMGPYRQFTNNLHLYTDILPVSRAKEMIVDVLINNHYEGINALSRIPLMSVEPHLWHNDLNNFLGPGWAFQDYSDKFFMSVAAPMRVVWETRNPETIAFISDQAWRIACRDWLDRRNK